jgi:hypothetical protein
VNGRSLTQKIRDFDLYEAVDRGTARFAGLSKDSTVGQRLAAIVADPRKLAILVGVVAAFSLTVGILLATGLLAQVYESIYMFWPGRPWTDVMRDHPWVYGILALASLWLPFTLSHRTHWARAFMGYAFFWVGFLGGHIFW